MRISGHCRPEGAGRAASVRSPVHPSARPSRSARAALPVRLHRAPGLLLGRRTGGQSSGGRRLPACAPRTARRIAAGPRHAAFATGCCAGPDFARCGPTRVTRRWPAAWELYEVERKAWTGLDRAVSAVAITGFGGAGRRPLAVGREDAETVEVLPSRSWSPGPDGRTPRGRVHPAPGSTWARPGAPGWLPAACSE